MGRNEKEMKDKNEKIKEGLSEIIHSFFYNWDKLRLKSMSMS